MSTFLSRLRKDTSGNVMAMFAAAIIPLIGLVGGAMDASIGYMAKSRLQKACDAGVLAGRQSMTGTTFDADDRAEAEKFFNFNFPDGLYGAENITFTVDKNSSGGRDTELIGEASADIPTNLMVVLGIDTMSIAVECDAEKDLGHNDVMLVLDVTGSMAGFPSSGTSSSSTPVRKYKALQTGALKLYDALADNNGSITRYGMVPYSENVNVGNSLDPLDILVDQTYLTWRDGKYRDEKVVNISESRWGNVDNFIATSNDDACIEERGSLSGSHSQIQYKDTVTLDDVEKRASNSSETHLQFGRYDQRKQMDGAAIGKGSCPAAASKLQVYETKSAYEDAILDATSRVAGNTYHDIGMLWGLRFIARDGMFAEENPRARGSVPINQHIIFMTDGLLVVNQSRYTGYGVEKDQKRLQGSGSINRKHSSRFLSTCEVARSMGITVWVIALDVADTSLIEPCATSPAHFYVSDGSDLEEVFENIGRGIGKLRLSK